MPAARSARTLHQLFATLQPAFQSRRITMRKHSRALLMAASLATVSLVAACMGTSDGDTTEESIGDDVELRMTIWSAAPEHVEMFQSLGDELAEASPRVSSVTIESFNLADLDTLFTTQIDRKSTRLNSSHVSISYAVFCL